MKKQGPTIEWMPMDVFSIDPSKVIYRGSVEVWKEDPHDGETAHGTRIRRAAIHGILQEDGKTIDFCCALPTDRFQRLDIDLAHTIGGSIVSEENIQPNQYKVRLSMTLVKFNSTEVKYQKVPERWVETFPKKYQYFCGSGYVPMVPWTSMTSITVHYFVLDGILVWIFFSMANKKYDDWVTYAQIFKDRVVNGNKIRPREIL